MQIVPLRAVPSQALLVNLDGQACQINVYQKQYGLFLDLYLNNTLVVGGIFGSCSRLLIISQYLGFIGDLMWFDNQVVLNTVNPQQTPGIDPFYTGLGSGGRFSLVYLEASDLPNLPVGVE